MDPGVGEDGGRRQARNTEPVAATNSYVQSEHIHDKLKLLDSRRRFCDSRNQPPIERWCFAAAARNPSIQFQLFLDVCGWLATEITGDAAFFRVDKFDDPNTSVNKLMLALRKLEFGLDFPTSKLKQAHGEAACGVLDFLTDRAIEKNFAWQRPEYAGELEEEANVDEEADVGGIEDEVEVVEEEESMFKEAPLKNAETEDPEYQAAHQILRSGIDPIVWQTELERVGPRLRVAAAAVGGKEWRAHIEQTKLNGLKIGQIMPDTERLLKQMNEVVVEQRDKITLKENYINKQFEAKKESFATLKEELDLVESKFRGSTENVNTLTNELSGFIEQLDEMKGTMADRGNSMTDTSPLVQIKQALKQIKQEVITFDLQIGVVGHSLMQQKLRHGNPSGNGKGFKMRGKMTNDANEFEEDSDIDE